MSNSNSTVERFVYENVIDNRKGFRQLKLWETRLNKHNQRQQKATVKTAATKTAAIKKVQSAEDKARAKALAKEKTFEKWKLTQFRSTAFEKLTLEQKMNLKRVLSAKKSEEQIRAEYVKTMAMMRRENTRAAKMKRNKTKVVGKSAAAGGASGVGMMGAAGALMANPVVASLVVSTVTVGALIVSGTTQFKDTKTAANLTGMEYNDFAKLANGLVAVSESISDVNMASDKIKDLQDRQGEVIQETTFDTKNQQYKGGEGSILANELLRQGIITGDKSSLDSFMSQDPEKWLMAVAKATQGMDVKKQSFILEAFGSDLTNIIRGIQTQPELFQQAKDQAVTFDETQMKAATAFTTQLNKLASVFSNLDINVFKGFTENLSPETLEMFSRVGDIISDVVEILADAASIALNTISPFFNVVAAAIGSFTEFAKGSIDAFAQIIGKLSGMVGKILKPFEDIFDGFTSLITRMNTWIKDKLKSMFSWFGGDSNSGTESNPVTNNTPRYVTSYTTTPTPSKSYNPYGTAKPQPVTLQNETSVTVQIDAETVGRAVARTEGFNSGIDGRVSQMPQFAMGW